MCRKKRIKYFCSPIYCIFSQTLILPAFQTINPETLVTQGFQGFKTNIIAEIKNYNLPKPLPLAAFSGLNNLMIRRKLFCCNQKASNFV
jgi:hypothetical protein